MQAPAVAGLANDLIAMRRGTYYNRVETSAYALERFAERPIAGVGHFQHEVVLPQRGPRSVHNHFLYRLMSTGLLGMVPFLAVLVGTLLLLARLVRSTGGYEATPMLALAWMAGLSGQIVELLAFRGASLKPLWLLVGLALALAWVARCKCESDNKTDGGLIRPRSWPSPEGEGSL
jgi:O-antigen ligase